MPAWFGTRAACWFVPSPRVRTTPEAAGKHYEAILVTKAIRTLGLFATVVLLATALSSAADGGTVYRSCRIANGQIASCGGWYSGMAVALKDGGYRSCRIANGPVSSCAGWFNGRTVVWSDEAFRSCRTATGMVRGCGGWFNGQTVVPTDR